MALRWGLEFHQDIVPHGRNFINRQRRNRAHPFALPRLHVPHASVSGTGYTAPRERPLAQVPLLVGANGAHGTKLAVHVGYQNLQVLDFDRLHRAGWNLRDRGDANPLGHGI